MTNAVIYARYSSYAQTEQSIEGQLRECKDYASREGYQIVQEYVDRALTGRSDDRPEFQRMIADSAKKQFDVIIVWKLDRFARNRLDSAVYKSRLKKFGVRVVSAMEHISEGPEGIMIEGLLESLAEYYSANLAQNTKRGMQQSVLNGTYLGGPVPLGFKVVDKRLVTDEKTAPYIRYAFEQYAAGTPKKEILDELNAKGLRNSVGRALTMSSFQKIFSNEKYIGTYRYNGQLVAGGCDALVDEELFQRVQRRIESIRRAPAAEKAKVEYLLQGKLFCGMCGAQMIGESGYGRHGGFYSYYTCNTRKRRHECKKKNEKKDFLEWYLVEQTCEYVLTPPRMDYIADRLAAEYEKEFGNDNLAELERRIAKLEGDINKAVDASLEAPTKELRERYFAKLADMEAQRADLVKDLAALRIARKVRITAVKYVRC